MVSPISPLIANLFMEEFEAKALQSALHPPSLWLRFVDDTLVIKKGRTQPTTTATHQLPRPQHTAPVEEPGTDGSIPFLDTKVTPGPNNTILTTVYRKPTHTDQYLHWDNNHFITAKNHVYNTLAHRAKVVSSTPKDITKELEHLKRALMDCQFPSWAINRLQQQFQQKHNLNNNNT